MTKNIWNIMACVVATAAAAIFLTPAQAEPIAIGILQFQAPSSVPKDVTKSVEQFIYSSLTEQRRFRILERSRLDAVQAERAIQENSNVADRTALKDLGAKFVVLGEVTRAEVVRQQLSNGGTAYHATVAYGLRIIDVSTGAVMQSQDFSTGRGNPLVGMFAGFTGDIQTPAGAIDIALRATAKDLAEFIAHTFTVDGKLISVEKTDKNGWPESVLVSLGVADGVNRKTILIAYTTQNLQVDGKTLLRKKPLGELSFIESQGDHLSLFKVKKGASELGEIKADNPEVHVEFKP